MRDSLLSEEFKLAAVEAGPNVKELTEIARQVRVAVVRTVAGAHGGHIGGPLSAADLLVALYFRVLRVRPSEPNWPDRDRFVLSKGHSSVALYATMALRGFFAPEELSTFDAIDSRLQGHPDMTSLPGLDMSTGSLGLGIAAAVGIALGLKLDHRSPRVYVMLGDGECQEGSVWEAADSAARYKLDNLIAIVDFNQLQQYGWPEDASNRRRAPFVISELGARWRAFGWETFEVDGHDFGSILAGLGAAHSVEGRPAVVLARTVKGKGVPFMEGDFTWHARVPNTEETQAALAALGVEAP
jgi:transketolase